MNDFANKYGPWAIVTGASSGIGEEFCRQLASLKLNLVLIARRQERLEKLSHELISKYGIETKIIVLDISDANFLKQITTETDKLNIGLLVNNVGFGLSGNFLEHSLEEELSLLYVNCRAPLILSHYFGKAMVQNGKGGIINVSSVAAFLPMPLWTSYAASKTYDLHLSEGLWFELKNKGVDVLALCPGGTRTEFSQVAGTERGKMEPNIVVKLALNSLGKKSVVIPGITNRVIMLLTKALPRVWLVKIGAKVVSKMINHNRLKSS